MKVTVSIPELETGVSASNMQIGQFGRFVSGTFKGQHCLRTFAGLVLLEDPHSTWAAPGIAGLVEILPLGTKITLESTK
jgi:hypothetical protein